uniref:BED-type domain-containing protein n=2 Tax=Aegilops tauschii subsp. strangulata TaxID=200361 RepID=A0A453M2M2_AEGTS
MAANEGADGHEAAYDPMKDPTRKPHRSNDSGWKYGYWLSPPSRESVVCNLCGKITTRGIKRHKEHLAGCGGDATG